VANVSFLGCPSEGGTLCNIGENMQSSIRNQVVAKRLADGRAKSGSYNNGNAANIESITMAPYSRVMA